MRTSASVFCVTAIGAAVAAALFAAVPAASAAPAGGAPFTNPGNASPSVATTITPAGVTEIASVARNGSLWVSTGKGGTWHRHQVAGPGAAHSGPTIASGIGFTEVAFEGRDHTLQYYMLSDGRWVSFPVAGKGSAYSAPSLAEGPNGQEVAVQGPGHSLTWYALRKGHWRKSVVNGKNTAFSAPSLVIRNTGQVVTGHPKGEADIAVQGPDHSLSLYNSLPNGHWENAVVPGAKAYSAPSLVIFSNNEFWTGQPQIFVQGAQHTLWYYSASPDWASQEVLGPNSAYSAPSLAQGNFITMLPVAYQGQGHSFAMVRMNPESLGEWDNEVIATTLTTYSPPSLAFNGKNGRIGIATQGKNNSLLYYTAPEPASGAPVFTSQQAAGPGTTFGG